MPTKTTRIATVLTLLNRSHGASLAQLQETTGWLPHSTRVPLTELRKKEHGITWEKNVGNVPICWTDRTLPSDDKPG